MTREGFIRKWLANKDYSYNSETRDLMRNDLDKVIRYAEQKVNISNVPLDEASLFLLTEMRAIQKSYIQLRKFPHELYTLMSTIAINANIPYDMYIHSKLLNYWL